MVAKLARKDVGDFITKDDEDEKDWWQVELRKEEVDWWQVELRKDEVDWWQVELRKDEVYWWQFELRKEEGDWWQVKQGKGHLCCVQTACQMYVACEAADVAHHEKNGKLAKLVHKIMR